MRDWETGLASVTKGLFFFFFWATCHRKMKGIQFKVTVSEEALLFVIEKIKRDSERDGEGSLSRLDPPRTTTPRTAHLLLPSIT